MCPFSELINRFSKTFYFLFLSIYTLQSKIPMKKDAPKRRTLRSYFFAVAILAHSLILLDNMVHKAGCHSKAAFSQ